MNRRFLLLSLTAIAVMTAAVPPASAQRGVGIEITPNKFEYDLSARDFAVKILLVNHERGPRDVSLSVSGLGHNLDGDPQFLEPAVATRITQLSASEFVLPAGGRREIIVTGAIPEDERSLYLAVIAEFEPPNETDGAIEIRRRVASLFLLRGPKPWRKSVNVVDVGVVAGPARGPGKTLTLFAAARNDGNVHVRPTGYIDIFQDDRLLDTVPLKGDVIIPGFARRLTGRWTPPADLDGLVRLEAVLRNPAAAGSGTVDFSQGEAERPGADITDLSALDEGGAYVNLILTNTGNIPLTPTLTLTASEDEFERARETIPQEELAVGEQRVVEWRPDLEDGVYLITATASLGEELLAEASTGLQLGSPAPGDGASILRWIALALFVCITVAVAAFERHERAERRRRGSATLGEAAPVHH